MLEDYKKSYTKKNVQFIAVNPLGEILESDNVLFTAKESLFKLHPFFLSFLDLLPLTSEHFYFSCVHLDIAGKTMVCDIKLENKTKTQSYIVIHDLSEHYNAYQVLAQSRNESVISKEILQIKNVELQEKEAFKNKFIANFSHEIRNPLTSIIAFANILANTKLNQEQKEYLKLIQSSSTHLKLMLEDILNISKIESGKLMVSNALFNLEELLEFLRLSYTIKAKEKGLSFTLELSKDIPKMVEADKLRISQILINLLENALKFTQEGGITLRVKCNQKRANISNVLFEVADTGIGIAIEDQEIIFDSFTQAADALKHKGTGLGLTIVAKLLQLMKSQIKLKSTPNKGSSFYFNIGLKTPLPSQLKQKVKKKTTLDPVKTNKKYSVLLVEDDSINQMIVMKLLATTQNFYLDLVTNGEEVIERLIENKYDLIIMDIKLPGLEGHHVAKLIRELPFKEVNKTPILGLTASAFTEDLKQYKKAGMNAIVEKPFEQDVFLKQIYKWIKK